MNFPFSLKADYQLYCVLPVKNCQYTSELILIIRQQYLPSYSSRYLSFK